MSEPPRASVDVYADNSLIVWTKEDAGTIPLDDFTVAYDMPWEDPFDGDVDGTEEIGDDEEEEEEEYFAASDDEKGTGLTDTSHPSDFMPNAVQRGKTDNLGAEDPDSSATLGVSNCTVGGAGDTLLGGQDEGADDAGDAATLLFSDGDGGSDNGTVATSRKATTNIVSTHRDESSLHMRSFLAGMATLFLAQVGMAFLGLTFLFFLVLIKTLTE